MFSNSAFLAFVFPMIFREASLKDIPAMSELRLSVKENVLSDPSRITDEMYREYLTEIGKGWLCEVKDEVVGFSVASAKDASIWALFVRPEHEGKGIGTRLLELATQWLFASGASSISLRTATDTRADGFYERLGWKRGEINDNGERCYGLSRMEAP
jgi:GNAT superfamily N-acetyltransferase